ncbi:sugar ABC transporter ATP-binding protein [Brevibacillus laterosporus]|uniref:sugar ABC transporter ATP-binding protein n=1 Tax=Brevibacillus laterosporus TaxID=1465 RepID=UPI000839BBC6|nr:sugar ABC transporter ATP-binding protein [Brevibacillus laterosporus]
MTALEMKGIKKAFRSVPALRGVDFTVRPGEVHALLGANGAGKSTLMKIMTGAYALDAGQIFIDGKEVSLTEPQDAKAHGIQCVYQEVDTALIGYGSVAENILLEGFVERGRSPFINWRSLEETAAKALKRLGLDIPVQKKVEELTLSEKQLVLLAKAIAQKAKIIILDEPTAPLSQAETVQLFQIIKQLREQGIGIVFISHRMPEVFEISDRITVLRDGELVLCKHAKETNPHEVITSMLGKALSQEYPKGQVKIGERLLTCKNVVAGSQVRNLSFTVHEGEIVGIAGLVGAGKSELARVLFGADPLTSGEVYKRGKKLKCTSPKVAVDEGIALIPEERRREGIMAEESVAVNLTMTTLHNYSRFGFLRSLLVNEAVKGLIQALQIKVANPQLPIGSLSGGNQQKVVIGKWLATEADIFILDEPTKGVDVGAKSEIYRIIGNLAKNGKGIVYLSCEFEELVGIADRILVMYDGSFVKELSRSQATVETIMYYASGGQ